MVNLKFEKKGSVGLLKLKGEVNITEAGDLKEALLKAMGRADKVYLDAAEVTCVDISCLQLLCSAHRTSVKLNKTLSWNSAIPAAFNKTSNEAGFLRHVGCVLDAEKSCIWVMN
jgi:anti-anti-sigma regulatory factor